MTKKVLTLMQFASTNITSYYLFQSKSPIRYQITMTEKEFPKARLFHSALFYLQF